MVKNKTLYVVAGDYGFDVPFTLEDFNGDVVNITGNTAVKLKVAETVTATSCYFIGDCSVVSAAIGSITYTVADGNFETAGVYPAEVEVSFATRVLTFRNLEVQVYDQLASTDG
jgi:hypothetical protein